MEPDDDRELNELLKEWRVADAPRSLDERVLGRRPWWRTLLTGSIRIPVPVALAVAAGLLIMAVALLKPKPNVAVSAPSVVNLEDFRPVSDLNVRVIRHGNAN